LSCCRSCEEQNKPETAEKEKIMKLVKHGRYTATTKHENGREQG
jgi:hypothetical protein